MIAPPPSWQRTAGENVLVLSPPRGGGRIRYYAELPPRPFRRLVDEILSRDPGFEVATTGRTQRAATQEGEYGAWVELGGRYAGRPARRWIAVVFLDFVAVALDGLSLEPAADRVIAEETRRLFDTASFGEAPRRRRYLYTPPPGWQGLPLGLLATWYPPDYPGHRAQIVVYPAEPSGKTAPEVFEELIADEERRGFVRTGGVAVESFSTHLLTGYHHSFSGSWPDSDEVVQRQATVLADSRYHYVARLESIESGRLAEDGALLRALATSIEPLPHRGHGTLAAEVGTLTELSGPWAD